MLTVIGIAGLSGSGKSTLAEELQKEWGDGRCVMLSADRYYRHRPDLTPEERAKNNYDHPDACEDTLFIDQIKRLREGRMIRAPVYDFTTHLRRHEDEWTSIEAPSDYLIVDGILIFVNHILRSLFDVRVFVDTDLDECLIRRIQRDMAERGRTLESVLTQWRETVKPMAEAFCLPTKRDAHIIVPRGGHSQLVRDMIVRGVQRFRDTKHGTVITS